MAFDDDDKLNQEQKKTKNYGTVSSSSVKTYVHKGSLGSQIYSKSYLSSSYNVDTK